MAELCFSGRLHAGAFCLEVPYTCVPGEGVTVLFGASGSGKSTLLHGLAGLLRDAGFSVHHGSQVWQSTAQWHPPQHRQIGMVRQQGGLFPHLTVAEQLKFPLRYTAESLFQFDEVVEALSLGPLLTRRPHQLSGGQRQRVALAQALLRQPQWLFLDEPLVGLDQKAREMLLALLEQVIRQTGVPTLLVTHALDEVERLGDRVLFIENGRVQGVSDGGVQKPVSIWQAVAEADSPLFHEQDPVSLLRGVVVTPRNPQGLGEVQVGQYRLLTQPLSAAAGDAVRLRIAAKQLLLSRQRLEGVSALNQLALEIVSVKLKGAQALVKLRVEGEQVLWATLTQASATVLELSAGKSVWVVIKVVGVQ